jgi:hypothetical protein
MLNLLVKLTVFHKQTYLPPLENSWNFKHDTFYDSSTVMPTIDCDSSIVKQSLPVQQINICSQPSPWHKNVSTYQNYVRKFVKKI